MSLKSYLFESWDHHQETFVPKTVESLRTRHSYLLGGAAAGFCGGVLMALFEMGNALLTNESVWMPFYRIDEVLRGFVTFVVGQPGAVVTGLLVHFVVSTLLGTLFAVLARFYADEESTADHFFGGLAFGTLIWGFVNYGFVMRWLPAMDLREPVTPEIFFFAHLVFGATLALKPIFARAFRGQGVTWTESEEDYKRRYAA